MNAAGTTAGLAAYARPGAMVVTGRSNYGDAAFRDVAAAGGHVLIYLDAIVDASWGRYHEMLLKDSACGPAVPRWPGDIRLNETGYLTDFRAGGVLQGKLECVLEAMVAENPHVGGFFADDLGSRNWFAPAKWDSWSAADKRAYREGAIALSKTFRKVADRYGLIVLVNGSWGANDGGGYPDPAQHGNALADGAVIEHRDGQVNFFTPYACSDQWAAQSAVTRGTAFNYALNHTDAQRTAYARSGCIAWAVTQTSYETVPPPWGPFHATGLRSGSSG